MAAQKISSVDRQLAETASTFLAQQQRVSLKLENSPEGAALPAAAVTLLKRALELLAQGKTVTVLSEDTELSTQEGADILNVSRPYFVGLLERGQLPYRKVGTHRRVLLADVLAYKRLTDTKREKVLEELAEQAQELNLGYE